MISCWANHESLKYYNKIVWSTLVQLLGKLAQIVMGMVSIKLVTNALGADEYGLYGKISEYALFFSVAANLGIFGNTVRKMSESPRDGKLFVNALVLRMATALIFFGVGAGVAWIWIPNPVFALGMVFFMGSLFLDYITSVCDGMLQANYKMGRAVAALVLGRAANLALLLVLVKMGAPTSAPIFFLGPLLGAVVTASLSFLFVRRLIRLEWKLDRDLMKMLFLTALPFGIINIINNLYFRFLPSLFAAKTLTDAQYGSYNLSLHIASTAALLSTLLMFSSLPALKQAIEHKEKQKIRDLLHTLKKSLFVLAILMVLGGSFVAPTAIELLSGKLFILPELWFILPMLLILAAVSYFYDLVLITLFAFEKDLWLLKREGLALLVGLSLLLVSTFIPDLGLKTIFILGSAIAAEGTTTVLGLRKIKTLI
ncbi:MAG: oligosaccharide flippase family protein [Patescibacteria group bacterium]